MPKPPRGETPRGQALSPLQIATTVQLYELRVRGFSDEEIQKSLSIDHGQLKKLEETLLSEQAFEAASETPERTFAKYKIDQKRNIRALDELIEELDGNTQYNAVVGAIRLRADLQDRIIDTAQKLGVMKRPATEHNHNHKGSIVTQLSMSELRSEIMKMGDSTRKLIDTHGEESFLALPEGEIYYGEAGKDDVEVPTRTAPERVSERPRKKKKRKLARQRLSIS